MILQEVFNEKYIKNENLLWHDGTHFIAAILWKERHKKDSEISINNGKIVIQKNNSTFINEIENDDLEKFLSPKLTTAINMKLSNIVNIGGESIILKDEIDPVKKVAKIVEIDISSVKTNEYGLVDEEETYQNDKPKELTANDLEHDNIIKYSKSSFQYADGQLFHITSK